MNSHAVAAPTMAGRFASRRPSRPFPRDPRQVLVPVVAAILALAGPAGAWAADDAAVEALKADLARVQAENARLKQELAGRNGTPTEPPAAAPVAAAAASAPQPESVAAPALAAVNVKGRNRLAALQDTPVAASVVSGDELQRLNATTVRDITKRVANVTRQNSSNARSADLAIRGIGRKGNSEAQDPNVGITVDGVSYGYAGLSAWDWVDIDSVQVLRGPVGTAGGKNSNVGGLYINTRKPSFTPGTEYSIAAGQRDGIIASAAITGPVIDDTLAWRGTFYFDKVRGYFRNSYDSGDNSYTDRNKLSLKLQLLWTPTQDFSALLSVNKQPRTAENDNGLNLFHDSVATYSDGKANTSLDAKKRLGRRWFGQLDSYDYSNNYLNYNSGTQNDEEQRPLVTGIQGVSADLNWQLGDYALRSITAFQNLYFDARNDEGTPFDISSQGGGGIRYKQWSQELRLSSPVGGAVDWQAGLYAIAVHHSVDSKTGWGSDAGAWFASDAQYASLDADGAGRNLLSNSLNYLRKLGTADNRSFSPAAYGQFNWHLSDAATLKAGLRVTHEHRSASNFAVVTDPGYGAALDSLATTPDVAAQAYFGTAYASLGAAQKAQLKNAAALRAAQLGTLFAKTPSQVISQTQKTFNVSPSYKFDEQVTGYFTYQHGEKGGVAQVVNGVSINAAPESTNNFELGLKGTLFDKTLTVAADVFQSNIRDYQQQAYVIDPVATAASADGTPVYVSATGNAPKARAKGFELDATYTGIPNTTLRLSGAIDDVRYVSFTHSAAPAETNPSAAKYQDVSGRVMAGAARYTGNVGAEYRIPLPGNRELHLDGNYAYTSGYNSDVLLSQYGWIKGYGLTDLGLGIARIDRSWDVTLLGKNVFNVLAKAYGFTAGTLDSTPRWIAIQVSGRI
jgi:iron complex outermembrane receptor protein